MVHLGDDGSSSVLDVDVVSWWEALTSWAERQLPALRSELSYEAADEEGLAMVLEDAVEPDFKQWLHKSSLN